MSSKEVAKKEETTEVAIPDDVMAEMEAASNALKESLDLQRDVRLPQLRLVQATTQNVDANAGQLFDTLTSEATDDAEGVVLKMWKTRALFSEGAIGDPPVCNSPDGVRGFGVPGGDCTRCPHAQWQTGGRCQLRFNYLMMLLGDDKDPENELPRAVMMHGTSAKVASRLNTLLLGAKYPWSNVVRLGSVTQTNDRGQFKVWDVRKERGSTTQEQLLAFEWFKRIGAAASVTVADDADDAVSSDIPF